LRPDGGIWFNVRAAQDELLGLDATGQLAAHYQFADYAGTQFSLRAFAVDSAGTAYVGLENGVYAVDSTGELLWSYKRDDLDCLALALTGNGRLFVLTDNRILEF
jgi:outer membrane protein assembly factor BamB